MRTIKPSALFLLFLLSLLLYPVTPAPAQDSDLLNRMQNRVTKFSLDNGLTFLVFERHKAPVVSFATYVDVGAVNEHWGITGMAHMFEHMAFKGTRTIGTTNYKKEKKALENVDKQFQKLLEERRKGPRADADRKKKLQKRFKNAQKQAQKYVERNEYTKILQRAGGDSINAATGADFTVYMASLPANKVKLWFAMESERFLNPVIREFYKERNVVKEEKRSRENNPIRGLLQEVISSAYRSHPYGVPVIGNTSDLNTFTRQDAREFFETYYVPRNMTVAVVGDVDPEEIRELAGSYFGRLPDRPEPEPVDTKEPDPGGEIRVYRESNAQPSLIRSYQMVPIDHSDYRPLDALASILGDGRTSRLHRRLVQEKKLARNVSVFTGFPGNKFKGQFVILAQNNPDVETSKLEAELDRVLANVRENGVTDSELKRVQTKKRASLIRQMDDNLQMGMNLLRYEVLVGNWRSYFKQVDAIKKLTAEDLQRVAKKYIKPNRRVTGTLRSPDQSETSSGSGDRK